MTFPDYKAGESTFARMFFLFFLCVLLNFTKNLVRAFSSFRWECAKKVWNFSAKIYSFLKFLIWNVLWKLHIYVWSFDVFFYPFAGTLLPFMVEVFLFLLWTRSFYPFVVVVYLSFCGGGLFILLWWWSLYPFVVNKVGGFGCIPGFDRNIAHFIFEMFWVVLFGCYFVKIYVTFFDCELLVWK